VGAAAGHELDADGLALAGELATETGGNPFFVTELLRNLTESGAITYDETAARWSVDLAAVSNLPASVREVIEHRVDRLGADARETFTIAAVIGRSFDVALLTELVEIPDSLLLDQLEAAVGATLLHESTDQVGQFTFEHALINHTLYQGLGATRRARLHHRVALALESLYGTDAEEHLTDLATHWRLAFVTIDTAKAAGYSTRAGRHALDSLAPTEAAKLFSAALELLRPQDAAERCEALIGLGEAQRLTADTSYRETLLEASRLASDLEDGERAARAALANSRGSQPSATGQVDHERVAAIERALELDDDPNRRALLLSLQALELVYEHDPHRRRALAEQALNLARETGNPRTTARVLNDYQHVFYTADGLEQRLAHLDEMAAATKAANDPALEFWTTCREHNAIAESGQLERLADASQRQVAIAERVGEPAMRYTAAYDATTCMALLRGDLTAAEHGAVRALQIGTDTGQPDAELIFGAQIMHVRLLQGRASEIIDQLEQSVAANPLIPAFNGLLACTLCWLDRRDEAARLVAQAAEDRFQHIPRDQVRTAALTLYADAAAQAGETSAAEILYQLIEPWADQIVWNGAVTEGHARTYLGLLAAVLGRDEQADQDFARAIEIQQRGGMLVWAARAHLGWAESLFARGQRSQAREQAQRALELSREHGYGAFEPRAAALLDAPISAGT
jgi:predicted ATPase